MTTITTEQRLQAPIYASAAVLRQYAAPTTSRRYSYVIGVGLFSWSASSAGTDDGYEYIASTSSTGRWVRVDQADIPRIKIHTADGALVAGCTNVLTSAADGMTIPLASSCPGKVIRVINDMAATTATLTASGSDTIAGGTTGTTHTLAFGAPGWVELQASQTAAKWYAIPRAT